MSTLSLKPLFTEALGEQAELAQPCVDVLDYASRLLDDEDNLTKVGNLTGDAKTTLQARILECLGVQNDESDDGLDSELSGLDDDADDDSTDEGSQ